MDVNSQVVETDRRSHGKGAYVQHPPGSVHRPSSREGCLLFVTLDQPIEDLQQGG